MSQSIGMAPAHSKKRRRWAHGILILVLVLVGATPAFATSPSGGLSIPSLPPLTAGSLPAAGGSSATLGGTLLYPLASQDMSYRLLRIVFGHEVSAIAHGDWTAPATTQPGQTALNGTGSILAAGFGIYNMAILIVVALMTVWGTVTGILHSANTGEVFGEHGSLFWGPIRIVVAGAALLPVLGGYSPVQGIVIWGSLEGAAVADAVSNAMIREFVSHPQITAPMPPQGRQIAAAMLASDACEGYYNYHAGPELTGYDPKTATPTQWYVDQLVTQTKPPYTTYTLYDPPGAPIWVQTEPASGSGEATTLTFLHPPSPTWRPGSSGSIPPSSVICGSVGLKVPLNLPSQGLTGGLLSEVHNTSALKAARDTMMNADFNGLNAANNDALPLAEVLETGRAPVSRTTGQIVPKPPVYMAPAQMPLPEGTTPPPPPPPTPSRADVASAETQFAKAGPAFDRAVARGSATVLRQLMGQQNLSAITQAVQAKGWLTLGSLWLTMARIDQSDHNVASPHVTASFPSTRTPIAQESRGHTVIHQAIAVGASPTLNLGNPISASARSRSTEPWYDKIAHELIATPSDWIAHILMLPVEGVLWGLTGAKGGGFGSTVGTVQGTAAALTHGNPLIAFMNAGQFLLTMAGGLLVLWVAVKVGGALLGKLAGGAAALTGGVGGLLGHLFGGLFGRFLAKLTALAFTLMVAFLVGGFALGVLLPALPMLAFWSGVAGWLLMVAETLVAAPLWAATHASFEGSGWAPQRALMGYQLIAGLILRPILLVFGLFLALALIEGTAWFIGTSLLGWASDYLSGTQSITQALEADGIIMLLIGGLLYISHMSVRVISLLPDQVLKWIGGGTDALGGATDMEGKVREVVGVVVSHGKAGAANAQKILGDNKEAAQDADHAGQAAGHENREVDANSDGPGNDERGK